MADYDLPPSDLSKLLLEIFHHVVRGGDGADQPRGPLSFVHRARESLREKSPQIRHSIRFSSSKVSQWAQEGGPWRTLLVAVVGIVLLLGLAGLAIFLLFFLIATVNAVAIGFLGSIASVGAVAALFFTSLIFIYIVAIIIAVLSISTITFVCVCAVLVAAGWIAFLWLVWEGAKRAVDLFKTSCVFSVDTLANISSNVTRHYEKKD